MSAEDGQVDDQVADAEVVAADAVNATDASAMDANATDDKYKFFENRANQCFLNCIARFNASQKAQNIFRSDPEAANKRDTAYRNALNSVLAMDNLGNYVLASITDAISNYATDGARTDVRNRFSMFTGRNNKGGKVTRKRSKKSKKAKRTRRR